MLLVKILAHNSIMVNSSKLLMFPDAVCKRHCLDLVLCCLIFPLILTAPQEGKMVGAVFSFCPREEIRKADSYDPNYLVEFRMKSLTDSVAS